MSIAKRTLSAKEILYRSSLSRSPLYREVARGTLPKPEKKGRANIWSEAEFERWCWDPDNFRADCGQPVQAAAD